MAKFFSVRVQGRQGRRIKLFPDVQSRLRAGPMGKAGKKAADAVRFGKDGLLDQFRREATINSRGQVTAWIPSQRAIREGGRTLDEFGNYKRAWTAKGPGSITRISKKRLLIGVNDSLFPQATVFQAIGPTVISTTRATFTVDPRPLSLSGKSLDRVEERLLDHVLGEAA